MCAGAVPKDAELFLQVKTCTPAGEDTCPICLSEWASLSGKKSCMRPPDDTAAALACGHVLFRTCFFSLITRQRLTANCPVSWCRMQQPINLADDCLGTGMHAGQSVLSGICRSMMSLFVALALCRCAATGSFMVLMGRRQRCSWLSAANTQQQPMAMRGSRLGRAPRSGGVLT